MEAAVGKGRDVHRAAEKGAVGDVRGLSGSGREPVRVGDEMTKGARGARGAGCAGTADVFSALSALSALSGPSATVFRQPLPDTRSLRAPRRRAPPTSPRDLAACSEAPSHRQSEA